MNRIDKKIILVGQGISGTMLSWFLYRAGIDFVVIDNGISNVPSQTAAGIINPVTGRRIVTVWMDEIIIPFAKKTYFDMAAHFKIEAITKTSIIDFFPNPFMKEGFLKRIEQQAPYISMATDEYQMERFFNYELGAGMIHPTYIVHLQHLLPAWRSFLASNNLLIEGTFEYAQLQVRENSVGYKNLEASQIIFCDGIFGESNPYFSRLPFAMNKGEALIVEIPELPWNLIYKKSMLLAPFIEKGTFWMGTNHLWNYKDNLPTEEFRIHAGLQLKNWLKVPYKIIEHKAAIRPATVERRPFVGFHPDYSQVGILNGLGAKGCSLAPYFAHQLTQHILYGGEIEKEASIHRHWRILSKSLEK